MGLRNRGGVQGTERESKGPRGVKRPGRVSKGPGEGQRNRGGIKTTKGESKRQRGSQGNIEGAKGLKGSQREYLKCPFNLKYAL